MEKDKEKDMYKYANAPAYKPEPVYTDPYCLYLTFSNGFPLTETQILNFFNRDHFPFVKDVFVYRRKRGSGPPLFGKMVFKRMFSPDYIMKDREKAFFCVEGRPLWCRRWVSKKKETTASASSNSTRDVGSHHSGDQ